jgi:lipoprotein signal peptidase
MSFHAKAWARPNKFVPQWTVLALLVSVIVPDQVTKWWAWRAVPRVSINFGGNPFVGHTVGGWFANPLAGALLDLLDVGLLSTAVLMLMRRRYPAVVRVSGALMLGGWSSNLLDRLGMHFITAPGSVRGAVDFIHVGAIYYNIADLFIAGGTLVFLLAIGYVLAAKRRVTSGAATTRRRLPARARLLVVACAVGLIMVVMVGAVHYTGLTTPDTSTSAAAWSE